MFKYTNILITDKKEYQKSIFNGLINALII